MKITTVTYRFSAKRTENYQSNEASVELTAQVEADEKPSVVLAAIKLHAKQAVLAEFAKKTQVESSQGEPGVIARQEVGK